MKYRCYILHRLVFVACTKLVASNSCI